MNLNGVSSLLQPTNLALVMLTAGLLLSLVRLVRGPSLPDRVVALDLMSALATGMSATYAIATDNPVFLDVALLIALISFLGTVAFAQYVRKQGAP